MKIFNQKKLQEVFLSTWTKFIDYDMLVKIITNNIELYATNWPVVIINKKMPIKSVVLTKVEFDCKGEFILEFAYHLPWQEKIATGTAQISSFITELSKLTKITGVFVLNYT